jgi:hypothetical protein
MTYSISVYNDYFAAGEGISVLVSGGSLGIDVRDESGRIIGSSVAEQVGVIPFSQAAHRGFFTTEAKDVTFRNSTDQYVSIEAIGKILFVPGGGFRPTSGAYFVVAPTSGPTRITGGDPPPSVPSGPNGPGTPSPRAINIHAAIISGRADPATVVTSPNVTLTGGILALGTTPVGGVVPAASWSSGLKIIPDSELLDGSKVPPITPNVIDVRIMRNQTNASIPQ